MLERGAMVGGKYEIEAVLGEGGMGVVYRAQHVGLSKRVALKMLNPLARADDEVVVRFRREARAAALIGHPGVADVYDIDETEDGTPYMVMEYLEGQTLQELLTARGRLLPEETVLLFGGVLDIVGAAHKAGIFHRDLKPSNIFLTTEGKTKVLDFGVLKFAEYLAETQLTKTGMTMGTLLYMAPEQMRDSRRADAASDLWSIGAMIYAALSGQAPFFASAYGAVLVKTLSDPHQPLHVVAPNVPEALSAVVDCLLSKNGTLRPASAEKTKWLLIEALGLADPVRDATTDPGKRSRDDES